MLDEDAPIWEWTKLRLQACDVNVKGFSWMRVGDGTIQTWASQNVFLSLSTKAVGGKGRTMLELERKKVAIGGWGEVGDINKECEGLRF